MGDLSKNFNRYEFRCLGNSCCSHSEPVHPDLIDALQNLRDIVDRPLFITSGFRCRTHNNEIAGDKDSFHTIGMAADIQVPSQMTPEEFAYLAECVNQFRNGGIGIYKTHIHVDVRKGKVRW